jgi:hypothetical protein
MAKEKKQAKKQEVKEENLKVSVPSAGNPYEQHAQNHKKSQGEPGMAIAAGSGTIKKKLTNE